MPAQAAGPAPGTYITTVQCCLSMSPLLDILAIYSIFVILNYTAVNTVKYVGFSLFLFLLKYFPGLE